MHTVVCSLIGLLIIAVLGSSLLMWLLFAIWIGNKAGKRIWVTCAVAIGPLILLCGYMIGTAVCQDIHW